jgi:hypothetical protein
MLKKLIKTMYIPSGAEKTFSKKKMIKNEWINGFE